MKLYDSRAGVAVEVMSPLDQAILADVEKEDRRYNRGYVGGPTVTARQYGVLDSSLGGIVRYGTSSMVKDIPGWREFYDIVQRECTTRCGGPRFDVCYILEKNQDGIQCVHDGAALGDVIFVDELRAQLISNKPLEWPKLEEIAWLVHQQHRDDIGKFFEGADKYLWPTEIKGEWVESAAKRAGELMTKAHQDAIDNAIKYLGNNANLGYPTGNTDTLRTIPSGPTMPCGCTPRADCPQHI